MKQKIKEEEEEKATDYDTEHKFDQASTSLMTEAMTS